MVGIKVRKPGLGIAKKEDENNAAKLLQRKHVDKTYRLK